LVAINKLNPADHFTLMMDHEIRTSGLAGNNCGIVLELEGVIDEADVRQKCQVFAERFPRSVARLYRKGRQYYWKDSSQEQLPVFFYTLDAQKNPEVDRNEKILEIVNTAVSPFETAPIEIHVFVETRKSVVLLRWFHPVCDAKGAELVCHHIFNEQMNLPEADVHIIESMFNKWSLWGKVKLAWKAISMIRKMEKIPSVLPVLNETLEKKPGHKCVVLSKDESDKVLAVAIKSTGMTGISLYFIGCMMRAIEQAGSDGEGEAYCVPYAVNFRRSKTLFPVFGNQISFLFAWAEKKFVNSRESLFAHLREQHKQAIKQKHDHAMLPLLQLGSWLPLKKHGAIVRKSPCGRERNSFWFSFTGNMDPEPEEIAGLPVKKIYYLCQVTSPPAFGVLISKFQGKIVLSFNYIETEFDPAWVDEVILAMKSELIGQ
jgi:hypothetical protein